MKNPLLAAIAAGAINAGCSETSNDTQHNDEHYGYETHDAFIDGFNIRPMEASQTKFIEGLVERGEILKPSISYLIQQSDVQITDISGNRLEGKAAKIKLMSDITMGQVFLKEHVQNNQVQIEHSEGERIAFFHECDTEGPGDDLIVLNLKQSSSWDYQTINHEFLHSEGVSHSPSMLAMNEFHGKDYSDRYIDLALRAGDTPTITDLFVGATELPLTFDKFVQENNDGIELEHTLGWSHEKWAKEWAQAAIEQYPGIRKLGLTTEDIEQSLLINPELYKEYKQELREHLTELGIEIRQERDQEFKKRPQHREGQTKRPPGGRKKRRGPIKSERDQNGPRIPKRGRS